MVLSAALPAVAAAPPTANRERQHSARAARPRGNPVLAWGSWDQKRSQDQVTPRLSGNAKALSDETRVAAARYQQPVLDSSWTHAAFRAFHEMRAGCPPSSAVDGDREVQDEAGGGGGKGPLAGVRRLSSNLPRCAVSVSDPVSFSVSLVFVPIRCRLCRSHRRCEHVYNMTVLYAEHGRGSTIRQKYPGKECCYPSSFRSSSTVGVTRAGGLPKMTHVLSKNIYNTCK